MSCFSTKSVLLTIFQEFLRKGGRNAQKLFAPICTYENNKFILQCSNETAVRWMWKNRRRYYNDWNLIRSIISGTLGKSVLLIRVIISIDAIIFNLLQQRKISYIELFTTNLECNIFYCCYASCCYMHGLNVLEFKRD